MDRKLYFTHAAKIVALISLAGGALLLLLGLLGLPGGLGTAGPSWKTFPIEYISAAIGLIANGLIIGVVCEISQNIARAGLPGAGEGAAAAPEPAPAANSLSAAAEKASSDPDYK